MIPATIRFCLENKLVVAIGVLLALGFGLRHAPFAWDVPLLPRDPVPVDAIPDIGENQQIVFTEWRGRSPQDVDDQIGYPLTNALLGIPGVRTVRSYSFFGFSSIYVIFEEDVEFYWSRSRVLEKLSSLPAGTLPPNVQPALGPDATALGQVFWYTLEGRDPEGRPSGGWDLAELRRVQDFYVRYRLLGAKGIAEVASVGGFEQEYQVDVDPDALRAHGVGLTQVVRAVRNSNLDVGARTIEINRVEYVVRGVGFVKSLEDLEQVVVKVDQNVPIRIRDVARVSLGPALRRGALDNAGAPAVGGVAVVRFGDNPLAALEHLKARIAELSPGLPKKVVIDWTRTTPQAVQAFAREQGFVAYAGPALDQAAWTAWASAHPDALPEWATLSQLAVVPFYDRTGLIHETLGTLNTALTEEILISIIVVIAMVLHLRSSLLISGVLPLAVLLCFVAMRYAGVDANVVALSGIAIAIGTMVDVGIVLCENMLRHLDEAPPDANRLEVIHRAASEVGGAVVTAVATTVISFLPVFAMEAAEGKLFRPLAYTKTFALVASVLVALTVLPPAAHLLFRGAGAARGWARWVGPAAFGLLALPCALYVGLAPAVLLLGLAAVGAAEPWCAARWPRGVEYATWARSALAGLGVAWILIEHWMPLGLGRGLAPNLVFGVGLIVAVLGGFLAFLRVYPACLRACLAHKLAFLALPAGLCLFGAAAWLGAERVFPLGPGLLLGGVAAGLVFPRVLRAGRETLGPGARLTLASLAGLGALAAVTALVAAAYLSPLGAGVRARAAAWFPPLGQEFMPPLDEGSFLYMPTTMPHASIGEAQDVLEKLDQALASVPEVEQVVGKLGRAETPLDPAPISMIETVVNYLPEFKSDAQGRPLRFSYDAEAGAFRRDGAGELIEDPDGQPFRQWRDHIHTPDDIWQELVRVAQIPGTTSAPQLQPIATRIVMLQTGMRAPLGLKVQGPDLETIERVCLELERLLKQVPQVNPDAVIADRIVGKPYLELEIDRAAIARHGLEIAQVQDVVEVAIGGKPLTSTVEGRERFPVRVRYARELRDSVEAIRGILVPTPDGHQIPLGQLAQVRYERGPQVIKSEDTFLTGYVLFDKRPGEAEVDVVEACRAFLRAKVASGDLVLPPGVPEPTFTGTYENQVRSTRRLRVLVPLALILIFLILYLQFRAASTTLIVFSGIAVALAGGFCMLWLYGQPWFLDVTLFGVDLRALFQVHPVNLSVAIWVGFIALFGIATDDGVVIATYLDQSFAENPTQSAAGIRAATAEAGERRIRPCLMTTATTLLALLPVLTSTGRGSDIMVPMAIPSFGGMCVELITLFVVPTLYCLVAELRLELRAGGPPGAEID